MRCLSPWLLRSYCLSSSKFCFVKQIKNSACLKKRKQLQGNVLLLSTLSWSNKLTKQLDGLFWSNGSRNFSFFDFVSTVFDVSAKKERKTIRRSLQLRCLCTERVFVFVCFRFVRVAKLPRRRNLSIGPHNTESKFHDFFVLKLKN